MTKKTTSVVLNIRKLNFIKNRIYIRRKNITSICSMGDNGLPYIGKPLFYQDMASILDVSGYHPKSKLWVQKESLKDPWYISDIQNIDVTQDDISIYIPVKLPNLKNIYIFIELLENIDRSCGLYKKSLKPRKSVSLALGGGGFVAMISVMAFFSVFPKTGLKSLDHIVSVSGSSWCIAQMLNNLRFVDSLKPNIPIQNNIQEWFLEWMIRYQKVFHMKYNPLDKLPNDITIANIPLFTSLFTIMSHSDTISWKQLVETIIEPNNAIYKPQLICEDFDPVFGFHTTLIEDNQYIGNIYNMKYSESQYHISSTRLNQEHIQTRSLSNTDVNISHLCAATSAALGGLGILGVDVHNTNHIDGAYTDNIGILPIIQKFLESDTSEIDIIAISKGSIDSFDYYFQDGIDYKPVPLFDTPRNPSIKCFTTSKPKGNVWMKAYYNTLCYTKLINIPLIQDPNKRVHLYLIANLCSLPIFIFPSNPLFRKQVDAYAEWGSKLKMDYNEALSHFNMN